MTRPQSQQPRMHADEVDIDVALVRRLIEVQHPQWARLPIRAVAARGTDNALYRLGDEMVVRLPVHASSVPALRKELCWLPTLAPRLPLPVSVPLANGVPGEGYPFEWGVARWLDGEPATPDRLADAHETTLDLASFIAALHRIEATDGPAPGCQGGSLAPRDVPVRAAMARLGEQIDDRAVAAVWEDALRAPQWDRPGAWVHGDLDTRNVLARNGRLSGVVDWGSLAIGDIACDVAVAWKMVPAGERETFRRVLGVDGATWRRARGWVISQSMIALGYYTRENNPVLVEAAWRWYREAIAEFTARARDR